MYVDAMAIGQPHVFSQLFLFESIITTNYIKQIKHSFIKVIYLQPVILLTTLNGQDIRILLIFF